MRVKTNSKKVKEGDTFVAIKGKNFDGHDYINEAIKNGAKKIIAQHGSYSVETLIVDDTKEYLSKYLSNLYDSTIKDLKIIGVTGTNGKTTIAFLLYEALRKLNIKSCYIGTLGFYLDNKVKELDRTTPESTDIYEMLLKCVENSIDIVIMEVSSHSLSEGRVKNLKFNQAIFTNLTQDHLDYHKTMENYRNAKSKLFKQVATNGKCIINVDDTYSKYMIYKENNNVTYGFDESTYQILDYKYYNNEMIVEYIYNSKKYHVSTKLLGKFNAYNLIAVIASLNELKNDLNQINKVVKSLEPPKGRLDIITYKTSRIIIDYAHTPDAVNNVLNTAKEFSKSKIYCIIGCGGSRDKSKRSIMSNIAMSLSDIVIITSDNPRDEDPKKIVDDMLLNNKYSNYIVELNRSLAIKRAIMMLKENDTLLILGKGHENYQIIGDKKYHFDDKEEVYKYIKR